jgi:hypothetical protein
MYMILVFKFLLNFIKCFITIKIWVIIKKKKKKKTVEKTKEFR